MSVDVFLEAAPTLSQALERSISRAGSFLLDLQAEEGFWAGELESDTTLESDSIKFWHWLGRVDRGKEARLVDWILKSELPQGGWPIYHQGPPELNASVKAYVALRLHGIPVSDPALRRAREVILRLGGLERVNSFEKVYLALFGCYPWDQVPALPPEVALFPRWFPFNLYEISYWSRTILVPLAVVYATHPTAPAASLTLDELWRDPSRKRSSITNFQKGGFFWRIFFLAADRLLKLHEVSPWKPWRKQALAACDRWITDRLVETDGLGAIFPAMLNAVFALRGLGYRDGDPLFERQVKEMSRLELAEGEALKVQPCFSPVWDTALSMYVLGKTPLPGREPNLDRAAAWLKGQEIRRWGDWWVKNPQGSPGGWAFEFRNPYYPDVDDTAQVLLGFLESKTVSPSEGVFRRGLDWLLSMQNKDGGFSSFDKNNHCAPLNHFPFADHNAMLDPSAPDITGRILELLAKLKVSREEPAVQKAIHFLRASQEIDGTWFGRWGVHYTYGTWLALRGLKAIGEPMESLSYQRAGRWLVSHQNADGGWGESCLSYDNPAAKGQGPSTPSQTAWALMALMSLGWVADGAFKRGLEYLVRTQRPDGNWEEPSFTGTGFPRVFYLKYHLYRTYFPLLALVEAQGLFQ
ncbi:MAG: squalene--hopene cyclase [Candidatus Omnitrophica bacterium]|nr:squalene--hopene cyclase [Candidatus Omnitrophota bacterium]